MQQGILRQELWGEMQLQERWWMWSRERKMQLQSRMERNKMQEDLYGRSVDMCIYKFLILLVAFS